MNDQGEPGREKSFSIERLGPEDVPQNVALSRSVGWKDVESEWRVLHDAAEVRGVRHEGRVMVQGALGDYGNGASLAKMVVHEDWQRRRRWPGTKHLEHLQAPLSRHQQVQHEKIGCLRVDQRECLLAAGGFAYDVAVLAQSLVRESTKVRIVVHDQDVATAKGVPTRVRSQWRAG